MAMVAIDDDDILTEILLRLSTESLIPLKFVCKRWRSLISSHHFSVLHTLCHPTTTTSAVILSLEDSSFRYYHLSLQTSKVTPLTLSSQMIQSCHGLLLLCRFAENAPTHYYIYNPITGLHRDLDIHHNAIKGLTLAFNPSKSAYYKLVCVKAADPSVEGFSQSSCQIDVFDSKSGSWTVIERSYSAPNDLVSSFHGVYWNNAVIWGRPMGGLLYFDVDKGTIGETPEIEGIHLARFSRYGYSIAESGGHLHFIVSDHKELSIFEMARDYSNWSFKCHVRYGGESLTHGQVLGIMRMQNEGQSFMVIYSSGKFMVYNRIDESFQEITYSGMEEFNPFCVDYVLQFVKTLALV